MNRAVIDWPYLDRWATTLGVDATLEQVLVGISLVWQQVDQAGIRDPVAQAAFLLRRLYPDMPAAWFDNVIDRLRALHEAGRWHGFERRDDPG